ncbi:membrane protein [Mycolicibacterium madagascariense]|uniref:Membrane protein n=1 Tax=Mycolicibacterium madagascariense TaxID=212765 RepID=A0A7I7XH78_9MYCO|nr:EamA family transporter [Mycolicibacterium madagascariense]MCV7014364.1 EamA family transporter [Mycolicibacterium madagascariense]BBZ28544.1 membrane protein [Mycolicibacterium madagascariense]
MSVIESAAHLPTAGISVGVLVVVVLAGVLHAGWNVAAHAITDRLAAQLTIAGAYTLAAAPVAVFAVAPRRGAWPFIVGSALMHLVYTALLMRSYRLGDFGVAYPVARAVAPVVVTAYSVAVLGEHPAAHQWAGIVLLCSGIAMVAVARPPGAGRPSRSATLAAIATGSCIAAYTVIDAVGVRYSDSVAGYVGWMFLLQGPLILAFLGAVIPPRRLWDRARPYLRVGLTSGLVSLVAYAAVIWAQARSPEATGTVAATREIGIVIAAFLGRMLYREPLGHARVVGAIVAFAGIVVTSL